MRCACGEDVALDLTLLADEDEVRGVLTLLTSLVLHGYHQQNERFHRIEDLLETIMSDQANIDAATAEIEADVQGEQDSVAAIESAVQALQAEVATLNSQGVDTSGLAAAIAHLDAEKQVIAQAAADASAAAAPAPAPAPPSPNAAPPADAAPAEQAAPPADAPAADAGDGTSTLTG